MNQNDKIFAVMSHVLGIFTGLMGALVIYFSTFSENKFVKENAKEALNFQITICIVYVISYILYA